MIEEVKLLVGVAVLQYGNPCIDPNQHRAYVSGRVVELTTMEFNVLYYLAPHPGWTSTREQLYRYAIPDGFASGLESVTSRIYEIRERLSTNVIHAMHGYGYRSEKQRSAALADQRGSHFFTVSKRLEQNWKNNA